MSYFTELRSELEQYLEPARVEQIEQAYFVARNAHRGQKRRSGEAYITHPVAAAQILASMRMDYQSIMATLLHDTLEDTSVSKEDLTKQFGEEVAELVDGVSKLTQIKFETRAEAQAENFRKMVMAMVRDIRVIMVKLADRLHNMRTLGALPPEKKRRIAIETLEIYAPIANRLGMHKFYIQLEDLGFKALYPMRYRALRQAVKKARGNRKEIMKIIEDGLRDALTDSGIAYAALAGRQKHLYSIYKKMRNKSASFAEIMDVYGFRVIIRSDEDCYRVLGLIHKVYKPLPERFKDYIAIPKANGYQSLHTTLFGPYGVPIEVQIRSVDMDRVAKNGIAAHWLYKSTGLDVGEAQFRATEWVKGLLEMQQSTGSSLEFIESVKMDLFPDEVYVFTPKGEIMELPRGATPVDFAYAVHSDIGDSCVAAKVNRRLAPLSVPLVNGQTVEVITAPGALPNPAWLNFVVTAKARSNIRHYLKSRQHAESIALGKRLLEKSLADLSAKLCDIKKCEIQKLLGELHYENFDELCEAVGLGNQVSLVIAQRLLNQLDDTEPNTTDNPLVIKGTEGMVVHFAEDCQPIPGDPIVGCLTVGQGIIVHTEQCKTVERFRSDAERFIQMCWEDEVSGDFNVDLTIEVINGRGVLAQLANAIAAAEANIDNITVDQGDGRYNKVILTLTVRDRIHLARVMRRIRALKVVLRIGRSKR